MGRREKTKRREHRRREGGVRGKKNMDGRREEREDKDRERGGGTRGDGDWREDTEGRDRGEERKNIE